MKNPGFQISLVRLVCAIHLAFLGGVCAETPPPATDPSASKIDRSVRTKPQVIFHVRRTSNYAATLHSQAKTQNNELPIDSNMPTSLQLSRSNANAAAAQAEAQAQQETAARQHKVKPPKVQKNHVVRPPASMKPKGNGNPHGNKGHKR